MKDDQKMIAYQGFIILHNVRLSTLQTIMAMLTTTWAIVNKLAVQIKYIGLWALCLISSRMLGYS